MSDLLRSFKRAASRAGILLDFDGTLSAMAEVPSEARPYPGVPEVLTRLARTYRKVAVVSGRSAHEIVSWLGPDLDVWGIHGAERSRANESEVTLSSVVAPFAQVMGRALDEARQRVRILDLQGTVIEDKRVMIGLHYRAASDPARAETLLRELTSELAQTYGLWQASGKMAFELRPPIRLSKADVVDVVAREDELSAILFAGDDTVDLPAFDALDRLEKEGVQGVRVAVVSSEAPDELVRRADLTAEGPAGMLELLEGLA